MRKRRLEINPTLLTRETTVMINRDVKVAYFSFFPLGVGFTFFSIFLMLSATGRSSGMVPPSSFMVCLTFAPTSSWARLAFCLPLIPSLLNFSSVCVARKRFAASSVLPMWSRICWLFFSFFRARMSLASSPP